MYFQLNKKYEEQPDYMGENGGRLHPYQLEVYYYLYLHRNNISLHILFSGN